ncbi:MAG: DUF1887 family CARF protein [Proteobacteria bacterium]|nr:DUF1887 family CARF protein [Pseudomonadota bacterium]
MFCFSTGNQTVNFLPVIQLKIPSVIIATTEKERGLNLKKVYEAHNIKSKFFNVEKERDINELKNQFLEETTSIKYVLWNITGGQKYHSLAMYEAFLNRVSNKYEDLIIYFEANTTKYLIYNQHKKVMEITADAYISLDDIFTLYNTNAYEKTQIFPEADKDCQRNLDVGKKALDYYEKEETFRKLFFAIMKPNPVVDEVKGGIENQIRKFLNSIKPKVNELKIKSAGYEDLEKKIGSLIKELTKSNDIFRIRELIKPLKLIQNPEEIFNEYWNDMKRALIDELNKKINEQDYPLINEPISQEKINIIKEQIKSLGGKISEDCSDIIKRSCVEAFSVFDRNGHLFEWMVASKILGIIEQNTELKSKVAQIHLGVKTKPLRENAQQDAELDIVITTRFGTTLVLEAKTYDFSGDTIEGKENQTLKKSGPYSKTIIVGPLLKSLEIRDNGTIKYPSYFDNKIIEQRNNAEKHNIAYACLDELEGILKKELLKG